MSRSFLSNEKLEQGQSRLKAPVEIPDGETRREFHFPSGEFSDWLMQDLLEEWQKDPDFKESNPILIGSGARRELAPRSDLDLLFIGPEDAVRGFVGRNQQRGLKIRARVPEDLKDWTVGVEVPDILALFDAKVFVPEKAQESLDQQIVLLEKRIPKERKKWLQTIIRERSDREERYDSIANVLEPNLKYGPGGLRDLDQARQIARLFPELLNEKDQNSQHALRILSYYAQYWTTLRQKLHMEGHGDVLVSAAQFDLARWLGMDHKLLMKEVQRGLSRVHFYSTWIAEMAKTSPKRRAQIAKQKLETRSQALRALKKDPSVLMQHRVRQELDRVFPISWVKTKARERGKYLAEVLKPGASEEFVMAVFGSRLIDRLCPEIIPLIGHVQHDQYHRYTADIHLQQACRQFQRILKKPGRLGVLASEVRNLSTLDRRILSWTVLFHDLMKGREGDHSELGKKLVKSEFAKFGLPKSLAEEVQWLVEHHLALSQAAFRRNPLSPSTWFGLQEIGAEGDRLGRLAIFTAIDICATNPEAWTNWKARLLSDLLKAIRSPSAHAYFDLQKALKKQKIADRSGEIDPVLVAKIPPQILAKDLSEVLLAKEASTQVFAIRRNEIWIRFHDAEDRPGIFADYVSRLYSLGLGIRHASVQTLEGIGVYDWFQVSTKKTAKQIQPWLQHGDFKTKPAPDVHFESVTLVSQDNEEWVFSFKGLDQPGCLSAAAFSLAEAGMSLRSARVHTWGRQVDDLFHITPKGDPNALLEKLRNRFVRS